MNEDLEERKRLSRALERSLKALAEIHVAAVQAKNKRTSLGLKNSLIVIESISSNALRES